MTGTTSWPIPTPHFAPDRALLTSQRHSTIRDMYKSSYFFLKFLYAHIKNLIKMALKPRFLSGGQRACFVAVVILLASCQLQHVTAGSDTPVDTSEQNANEDESSSNVVDGIKHVVILMLENRWVELKCSDAHDFWKFLGAFGKCIRHVNNTSEQFIWILISWFFVSFAYGLTTCAHPFGFFKGLLITCVDFWRNWWAVSMGACLKTRNAETRLTQQIRRSTTP